jgi:outer membrane protein OmpA-like peptidoglycan-associated protein
VFTLCALIAAQTAVQGDVRPEPPAGWGRRPTRHLLEGGLLLGGFFPASDPELYDSTQVPPAGLGAAGPLLGARLSYFVVPFLGAETEGGMSLLDPEVDGAALAYHLRGHLVLQVPGRFTPFVLGGGGLLGIGGELGDDVDRAAHWGLGGKYYLDDRWSVRVDGRHVISARQGPDAGNTNHFEASLGFGFALFRAPPPRRPVRLEQPPPEPLPPQPEPAPAEDPGRDRPAPTPVTVQAAASIESQLNDIRFRFDSAEIDPSMRPLLDRILEGLMRQKDLRLTLVGHACDLGPQAYNQDLSVRRAEAVRDHLVQRGISPDRLEVRGAGESSPVVPNTSPKNRQKNRRTEFSVEVRPAGP